MNHPSTVEKGVAGFFFNHRIDDLLPSSEAIPVFYSVADDRVLDVPAVLAGLFCTVVVCCFCFWVDAMRLE